MDRTLDLCRAKRVSLSFWRSHRNRRKSKSVPIVHHPNLLIPDEVTSTPDPESEAALCETLCRLRGRHRSLVILHQSALLKIADQSYYMGNDIEELIDEETENDLSPKFSRTA